MSGTATEDVPMADPPAVPAAEKGKKEEEPGDGLSKQAKEEAKEESKEEVPKPESKEAEVKDAKAEVKDAKAEVKDAEMKTESKAEQANGGATSVTLAGHSFGSRDVLASHIKKLQAMLGESENVMLGQEDSFLLFHLSTFHPNFQQKVIAPVVGFKYKLHPDYKQTKCFFIAFADGSEEPLSISKCLEVVFPKGKGQKRPREEEEQRAPQAGDAEGSAAADEPAAQRQRREMQEGCVLEILGIPPDWDYQSLREKLSEFRNFKFLELFTPHPVAAAPAEDEEAAAPAAAKSEADAAAPPKEGSAGEAAAPEKPAEAAPVPMEEEKKKEEEPSKTEGAAAAAESEKKVEEGSEKKVEESSSEKKAEEGSSEKKAEESSEKKPEESSETKAEESGEKKAEAASPKKTEEGSKAKDEEQKGEEEDDDDEEDDEPPQQARARFGDAESAALAAKELKDLDGHPITVKILEGEEERQFWERLWKKVKGKDGKGKDGKDKGKGRGKGKGKDKDKGKGKGKKGKGKKK